MPRRPSLAFVIRFLSIRISTVDRLTFLMGYYEYIYLNHFGPDGPMISMIYDE
jgi:hypothetical protein